MPLRCLEPDGQSIQSFDLSEAEWSALRLENRLSRQLRLPCCDASVVLKKSTLGLKFFAHKSRGPCQSAPETEAHLDLKTRAAQAARKAGWTCSTEASGSSPSGETWTADVLAQKGQHKVAIEIQWSGQQMRKACAAKNATANPACDVCGCFGGGAFPFQRTFPPLASVETLPLDFKRIWTGK